MKNLKTLILIVCSASSAGAQQLVTLLPENGDCHHPVLITDSIVISKCSPSGYGNWLEIKDNAAFDLNFFEKEHNTAWYYFRARYDATLTFDIVPDSIKDDYDFVLYKFTGSDFCNAVKSKNILPVRTCISRNNRNIKSVTGLNNSSGETNIHSGVGNSFAKSITVNKDEIYFLLIDNVYDNGGGHTIYFHWKPLPVKPREYQVGEILVFENIIFIEGTAQFDDNAYGWLDSLRRIMVNHPKLKVEIQGHVDGFRKSPTPIYQKISEARAKAVYEYLIENNIDSARMIYNGYGNSRMRYEYPDFQPDLHRKNRRVEIKVLSNK